MTRKSKAPITKSKLFELAEEIAMRKSPGEGITTSEIVAEFLAGKNSVPDRERDELLQIGLNVLAGRVTVMNKTEGNQSDLFQKNGLPFFVSLRIEDEDGKLRIRKYNVKELTPNFILQHKPTTSRNRTASKREQLLKWAEGKVIEGFGDNKVEDVLKD